MDVSALDYKLILKVLRAFRRLEPPPSEILTLQCLAEAQHSDPTLHLPDELYKLLKHLALEQISKHRSRTGRFSTPVNPASDAVLSATRDDFLPPTNEILQAWSALYAAFFEPIFAEHSKALLTLTGLHERVFQKRVEDGAKRMAEALRAVEKAALQEAKLREWRQRLPIHDSNPKFGIHVLIDAVTALLYENNEAILALEGRGGIGKTTIAHEVSRHFVSSDRFRQILWIGIRHQEYTEVPEQWQRIQHPSLTLDGILRNIANQLGCRTAPNAERQTLIDTIYPVLTATPHLVIIDNLESLDEAQALVQVLARLGNGRTRWLITTRESLAALPTVAAVMVPELSIEDSRLLILAQVERRRRLHPRPFEITTGQMREIYDLVGGVPLALKLLASQMTLFPLDTVLGELQKLRFKGYIALLNFIYGGIWSKLSSAAKHILLTLADVPATGIPMIWLTTLTELPFEVLAEALEELLAYSLLEIDQETSFNTQPMYRIHRLTTRFITTFTLNSDTQAASDDSINAWSQQYQSQQRKSLQAAYHLADQRRSDLNFLRQSLPIFMTLLRRAVSSEALQVQTLALIAVLHPLPMYGGYWHEWEIYLRFAIARCDQPDLLHKRAEFLDGLHTMLFHSGRMQELFDAASAEVEQARSSGSATTLIQCVGALISVLNYRGERSAIQTALASLEADSLIRNLRADGDALPLIHLHLLRGIVARRTGEPLQVALAHMDAAVNVLSPTISDYHRGCTYRERGVIRWASGLYADALDDLKRAETAFDGCGDRFALSLTHGNMALVYWSTGRLRQAAACAESAISTARQLEAWWQCCVETGNLALIQLFLGNLEQALSNVEQHVQLAGQLGMDYELARGRGNRGLIYLHLGHYENAIDDLTFDAQHAREDRLQEGVAVALANLAVAYYRRGANESATAAILEAQQLANEIGSEALLVVTLRAAAEVADTVQKSKALLEQALETATTLGRKLDRAGCLLRLAQLNMLATNKVEPALTASYLNEARTLLQDMDAVGWLDRCDTPNETGVVLLPMVP